MVNKYLNGLSPPIMNDISKLRKNIYNLRNVHLFESQNPRTKRYGLIALPIELLRFGKFFSLK